MKLELKHIAPYLPYKLKCQYFGIVDVLEYNKCVALFELPKDSNGGYGFKVAEIKEIKLFKDYWKTYIGIYPSHAKSFVNGYNFSPILRPLSDLTRKELEIQGFDSYIDWLTIENGNPLEAPYKMVEYLFLNHLIKSV